MAENRESFAEMHKKIREGSERVVFIGKDKNKGWPNRSIDPSKIEYRYREIAEIQDAAYSDGKKDGIGVGVAYALGLMCKLSREASEKCLDGSLDRNKILQNLLEEISAQNLIHCDYRYMELLEERLLKGNYAPMEGDL